MRDKITKILVILLFTAVGIAVYQSARFLYTFQPRVRTLMAQFYEEDDRLRQARQASTPSATEKAEAIDKKMSAIQDEIQTLMTLQQVSLITFILSVAAYAVLLYFLVLRTPRPEIDISRFG